jgi:hypothetical protein
MNDNYKHNYNDLSVSMLQDREDYQTKLRHEPNEILPDIAKKTIISIIGSTNSGKSVFINNLIYKFYYDLFDYIILISPSAKNDKSMYSFRNDPKVVIFEEYSDALIDELMELQKCESEEEYKDQPLTCIIFDDCANPRGCSKHDSKISILATRHRHLNINLVFSIQIFKQLSHPIRANTKAFIIKSTPNQKELEKMSEELCMFGGKNNFFNLYEQALGEDRYNFLYLDLVNGKAYKNFDTLLYDVNTDKQSIYDKERIKITNTNKPIDNTEEKI